MIRYRGRELALQTDSTRRGRRLEAAIRAASVRPRVEVRGEGSTNKPAAAPRPGQCRQIPGPHAGGPAAEGRRRGVASLYYTVCHTPRRRPGAGSLRACWRWETREAVGMPCVSFSPAMERGTGPNESTRTDSDRLGPTRTYFGLTRIDLSGSD